MRRDPTERVVREPLRRGTLLLAGDQAVPPVVAQPDDLLRALAVAPWAAEARLRRVAVLVVDERRRIAGEVIDRGHPPEAVIGDSDDVAALAPDPGRAAVRAVLHERRGDTRLLVPAGGAERLPTGVAPGFVDPDEAVPLVVAVRRLEQRQGRLRGAVHGHAHDVPQLVEPVRARHPRRVGKAAI